MFYYGLAFGLFVGVIAGFVVACICHAAHDGESETDRWERLKKEMGVEE